MHEMISGKSISKRRSSGMERLGDSEHRSKDPQNAKRVYVEQNSTVTSNEDTETGTKPSQPGKLLEEIDSCQGDESRHVSNQWT